MKKIQILLLAVILATSLVCKSQTSTSRIEIVEPTVWQETTSIWKTINDIRFFEKEGYTVNLPKYPAIDSLIEKSRKGLFTNEDFEAISALVEAKLFDADDYKIAIRKIEDQIDLLNCMINALDSSKSRRDWDFKSFDKYRVVLTLYGSGGSYDYEEGIITLLTDKEGTFRSYTNPAYTIIHEITHIGMEQSLILKHNVPHGLKERVVDTFVSLMFKDKLPGYRIQNMGNVEIDQYLQKKEALDSLDAILTAFMAK